MADEKDTIEAPTLQRTPKRQLKTNKTLPPMRPQRPTTTTILSKVKPSW